jgi:hypothetical protein
VKNKRSSADLRAREKEPYRIFFLCVDACVLRDIDDRRAALYQSHFVIERFVPGEEGDESVSVGLVTQRKSWWNGVGETMNCPGKRVFC